MALRRSRSDSGTLLWAAVAFVLLGSPPALASVELTTCGQTLTIGGFLTANLDCTGYSGNAVTIVNGDKLDLRGFALTGGDGSAIDCPTGCSVVSTAATRGTVRGSRDFGIEAAGGRLSIENLVVESNGAGGITSGDYQSGSVFIKDSEISANGGIGAAGGSSLLAFRSRVADNVQGGLSSGGRTKVQDCVIVGNSVFGISGGKENEPCCSAKLTVERCIIRRNGVGIDAKGSLRLNGGVVEQNSYAGVSQENRYRKPDFRLKGAKITDNADAGIIWIWGGRGRMRDAVIARNGDAGVDAASSGLRMTLKDSVITDNDGAGVEGLFSRKLKVTRCRVSGNAGHGISKDGYGTRRSPCALALRDSDVVDNGGGATCGVSVTCADVATCMQNIPSVDSRSTCGTSYVLDSGFPGNSWGVCAAD